MQLNRNRKCSISLLLMTCNFSLGGKIPEVAKQEEEEVDDSKLDQSESEVG